MWKIPETVRRKWWNWRNVDTYGGERGVKRGNTRNALDPHQLPFPLSTLKFTFHCCCCLRCIPADCKQLPDLVKDAVWAKTSFWLSNFVQENSEGSRCHCIESLSQWIVSVCVFVNAAVHQTAGHTRHFTWSDHLSDVKWHINQLVWRETVWHYWLVWCYVLHYTTLISSCAPCRAH